MAILCEEGKTLEVKYFVNGVSKNYDEFPYIAGKYLENIDFDRFLKDIESKSYLKIHTVYVYLSILNSKCRLAKILFNTKDGNGIEFWDTDDIKACFRSYCILLETLAYNDGTK